MDKNPLITLRNDPRLRLQASPEIMAINGGLQPFAIATSSDTLLAQVQLPERSYPDERIVFHWMIGSFVSRDGGDSWTRVEHRPGKNELYMEGGSIVLPDGKMFLLDTYVTEGPKGEGRGLAQIFSNDLRTFEGPLEITFDLPGMDFDGVDDGGNAHLAERLHRRILALPDGDLLATIYGWFYEDNTAVDYMPNGRKVRTLLLRSSNQGRHWRLVSTIAVGPDLGTEGIGEPDMVRISQGSHAGRLICYMRTGRALYQCISDDDGVTWTPPEAQQFGIIDVYDPTPWEKFFEDTSDLPGYARDMHGCFVDPNLIELKNGVLACAFGLRMTEKLCWVNPHHERNGNYLAFSFDHGATWSHIVQLTSAIMTTHYMNILELEPNLLHVLYDREGRWEGGYWDGTKGRFTASRKFTLSFDLSK